MRPPVALEWIFAIRKINTKIFFFGGLMSNFAVAFKGVPPLKMELDEGLAQIGSVCGVCTCMYVCVRHRHSTF